MNIKIKLNFFSHNKLKFQPRTSKRLCLILTILFNDNGNCSVLFNDNVNFSEMFCSM